MIRDHLVWDDTVWIVVSDHDQETVTNREPIDLQAEIAARGVSTVRAAGGQCRAGVW